MTLGEPRSRQLATVAMGTDATTMPRPLGQPVGVSIQGEAQAGHMTAPRVTPAAILEPGGKWVVQGVDWQAPATRCLGAGAELWPEPGCQNGSSPLDSEGGYRGAGSCCNAL